MVIFKREMKMNVCHVKLGGFPDWRGDYPRL